MVAGTSGQGSFLIGAKTALEKTSFITRSPPLAPPVPQGGRGLKGE